MTLLPTTGRAGRVHWPFVPGVPDRRDDDDARVHERIGGGGRRRPGQLLKASPIDMLSTFMPSARMRSMAAIITSSVTEPWQPKTR